MGREFWLDTAPIEIAAKAYKRRPLPASVPPGTAQATEEDLWQ